MWQKHKNTKYENTKKKKHGGTLHNFQAQVVLLRRDKYTTVFYAECNVPET